MGTGPYLLAMLLAAAAARLPDGAIVVSPGLLDRELIRRQVRLQHPRLRACYAEALRLHSGLRVRLVVSFTILGNGRVERGELAAPVQPASLGSCVKRVFARIRFPAIFHQLLYGRQALGGPTKVRYPLRFQPASEGGKKRRAVREQHPMRDPTRLVVRPPAPFRYCRSLGTRDKLRCTCTPGKFCVIRVVRGSSLILCAPVHTPPPFPAQPPEEPTNGPSPDPLEGLDI